MASNEKIIKDAQYRKGLSIGFFNATNSAVALVSANNKETMSDLDLLKRVSVIRDEMIEQHKDYYAKEIAPIGMTYDASEIIAKMNSATTLEELKAIWLTLSESARYGESILKAKEILKKKLK